MSRISNPSGRDWKIYLEVEIKRKLDAADDGAKCARELVDQLAKDAIDNEIERVNFWLSDGDYALYLRRHRDFPADEILSEPEFYERYGRDMANARQAQCHKANAIRRRLESDFVLWDRDNHGRASAIANSATLCCGCHGTWGDMFVVSEHYKHNYNTLEVSKDE